MAVSLATPRAAVEPDHVYVTPPDRVLTCSKAFSGEAADACARTAVPGGSPLLVTGGGVWGGAIGIVLSGADADGSL